MVADMVDYTTTVAKTSEGSYVLMMNGKTLPGLFTSYNVKMKMWRILEYSKIS